MFEFSGRAPQAGLKALAGRIRPSGRTLETPDLRNKRMLTITNHTACKVTKSQEERIQTSDIISNSTMTSEQFCPSTFQILQKNLNFPKFPCRTILDKLCLKVFTKRIIKRL